MVQQRQLKLTECMTCICISSTLLGLCSTVYWHRQILFSSSMVSPFRMYCIMRILSSQLNERCLATVLYTRLIACCVHTNKCESREYPVRGHRKASDNDVLVVRSRHSYRWLYSTQSLLHDIARIVCSQGATGELRYFLVHAATAFECTCECTLNALAVASKYINKGYEHLRMLFRV